ncbi:hypothetical protein J6590_059436 [Homalodisca vitripennis]|nr:hypothetical protein J6590_059436 [Homalodisca vitripennis]
MVNPLTVPPVIKALRRKPARSSLLETSSSRHQSHIMRKILEAVESAVFYNLLLDFRDKFLGCSKTDLFCNFAVARGMLVKAGPCPLPICVRDTLRKSRRLFELNRRIKK